MAITIIAQPQGYQPAYKQQWFTASSNQVAQQNFEYTVICTDLISGGVSIKQIPARPDTLCVFDAGVFSEQFIKDDNYIPINLYGWQIATGVRKIRVNIGETYGATPAYTAGSNIDFIIWNADDEWLDFSEYDMDDFVYDSATTNFKYFAGVLNDLTFVDRSNYIYTLTKTSGDLDEIQIATFDKNGVFIANSAIPNPLAGLGTYEDWYYCIDVGLKGLTNISALLVTGAFPIITASVASYKIYDNSSYIIGPPILIKTLTLGCQGMYEPMVVHYLANNGAFNTASFNKIWNSLDDIQTTEFTQNTAGILPGGAYGYNYSDSPIKTLSTTTKTKLILRTDWLSDDQVNKYKDCWSSPVLYLDNGSEKGYISLRRATAQYQNLPHYSKKLVQLEMEFFYSHTNSRQRC